MKRHVAVIGGGVAGLTAAYDLATRHGCSVTLLEAGERLGGTVQTWHVDGFTVELGPDSWVAERPETAALAAELGLAEQIVYSQDALRRTYLARGRTLQAMPDGMRMMVPTQWRPLLESPLFSWGARLAYLREPKRAEELRSIANARPAGFDEPVAAFVERHFGAEATETIAGPLLSGIFGGDIHTLSAAATLGPFLRLEKEYGSLITPTMARAQAERQAGIVRPLFASLRGGLEQIPQRLVESLTAPGAGASLLLRRPVRSLVPEGSGWRIGADVYDGVLLATPPRETRRLLQPLLPQVETLLTAEASSAIIVALCFDRQTAAAMRLPRGFGFLAPPENGALLPPDRQASARLLAATFMHHKLPHTTPEGSLLLRGFFGGPAAPALLDWEDDRLVAAARDHLSMLLGPLPQAQHTCVHRLPCSLPQYAVGHLQRLEQLRQAIGTLPGVQLAGNAYDGVGLSAVIAGARVAARQLAQTLQPPEAALLL